MWYTNYSLEATPVLIAPFLSHWVKLTLLISKKQQAQVESSPDPQL